jgi:hypothetical protein
MSKTFTYRKFNILVLIILLATISGLILIARGFLIDVSRSDMLLHRLVNGLVGLICFLAALWIVIVYVVNIVGARQIIVCDELLILRHPLRNRIIHWQDIIEFGTYTANGAYTPNRFFYIKITSQPDKRIQVCNELLENLRDLIDIIFLKAINAKFVIVENVAWLPFTKKIQLARWNQHDRSFL